MPYLGVAGQSLLTIHALTLATLSFFAGSCLHHITHAQRSVEHAAVAEIFNSHDRMFHDSEMGVVPPLFACPIAASTRHCLASIPANSWERHGRRVDGVRGVARAQDRFRRHCSNAVAGVRSGTT